APGVPTITQVTDTGVVANGGSTNDTTPTVRIGLSGTNAAAGDQVQLFNGTSALGSAIVLTSSNISNGFIDDTTAALAQGTYNFNAKITDIAGNPSGASSNYTVTIASGSLPDLIVTNFTWSPTTPTVGQPVLFSATIKNQGTAATPDGIVEGIGFLVDGATVTWSSNYKIGRASGRERAQISKGGVRGKKKKANAGTHTVEEHVEQGKWI